MPDKTAIIVEDIRNWARQHELTLTRMGFATSTAKDYADAVTLLRQRRFDLAVVDLSLGHEDEFRDLNGIFLLEHLTAKNIPVIVVTAFAKPELVNGIFNSFDIFAIMDKYDFDRKKFKDNVLQATVSDALPSEAGKKKKRMSHEKVEQLVVELLKKMTSRPRGNAAAAVSATDEPAKALSRRIFISHSSKDSVLAEKLARDLRAAGFDVWYDDDQIRVGDTIIDMIEKGISKRDYMIIVLSPDAVASSWVRNELLMFLNEEIERNKKVIMPVLCRDCDIPITLKGRRIADFRNSYEAGFAELRKALGF
jgi:CheY-like chemotaxis protein